MMLVALVLTAVAGFAAALVLPWAVPLLPAAHAHLALALGIMPLIFGAMTHFVPVLTRSAVPHVGIKIIPVLMLAAGALAVFSFAAANQIYYLAAFLALAAAAIFFGWILSRASGPLNKPHPCLHWYLAAIACLMLALAAVAAMALWPEQRLALKRLHLHLNTLGFVGLTAIATLQVLLPTAVGRFDQQAAARLRRDMKWALGGTLLVAAGAAWLKPLAWLGAMLWAVPLIHLGKAWLALYAGEVLRWHGAAPSLTAALAGFAATLLFGVLHAGGILNTTGSAHAFILAFLFPLVTGAASQLLPVWARPGPQTAWHAQARQKLGLAGGIRGMLFLGGGILLGLGWRGGLLPVMAALIAFLVQLTLAAGTMPDRDGKLK
ncbi:MAG: hypothetical protein HY937_08075 [Nitrosomonadales bacterium]|nr:hypothetical protein [Nitrosomonadales bacterium]